MAKIFSIVKMILLRNYRDLSSNIIIIAMPLALILILGSTFNGGGAKGFELTDLEIHISNYKESQFGSGLVEILEEMISSNGIIKVSTLDESKELIEGNEITCFIDIDNKSNEITIYKNQMVNFESSLIEGVIRTYVERSNAIYKVLHFNPGTVLGEDNDGYDYTQRVSLDKEITMNAGDYYGITMTLLFVLYGAMSPIFEIMSDRYKGLLNRMEISNASPKIIMIGKMIGYTLVALVRVYIVVILGSKIMDINWGNNLLIQMLYIGLFVIMTTSVGIMLGYWLKAENQASTAVNLYIVVTAFIGGTYTSVSQFGFLSKIGKYVSIIWWANQGVLQSIFTNNFTVMKQGTIIFTTIIVLSSFISFRNIKKGEA